MLYAPWRLPRNRLDSVTKSGAKEADVGTVDLLYTIRGFLSHTHTLCHYTLGIGVV